MRLHSGGVDAMVSLMAAFRPGPATTEMLLLRLTLGSDGFQPPLLSIPAGREVVLMVFNAGPAAAEVVSRTLGVAGVVAAGHAAPLRLRPLQPGEHVVVEHAEAAGAQAVLVARAC
jgi:hypothetical protein